MTSRALVIGGTGPTGPGIVVGLLQRGYDVSVLHRGTHEVDLPPAVSHVHADPHFHQSLRDALAEQRSFDLVIASYGRLERICDVFAGRTARLIAVGGARAPLASSTDPAWGPLGPPASPRVDEEVLARAPDRPFSVKVAQAQRRLFRGHESEEFQATYVAYPAVYGPRQSRPQDWSVIRRVLDGRDHFLIADGGIKLETRGFVENLVHAVLLTVDHPAVSSGKKYIAGDSQTFSMRQRIEFICDYFGHEMQLIDAVYPMARPCHPFWRFNRDHQLRDISAMTSDLGYRDLVSPADAVSRTIEWLLRNQPDAAVEAGLGDPFQYAAEDRLIAALGAGSVSEQLVAEIYPLAGATHGYDHPK